MWRGTFGALAERGIAASVGDLTRDAMIDGMASRMLADAPPCFVLVGFSLGGIVALEMVRRAPDRVAGLVLVDSNARPDLPERAAMRLRQQRGVRAGRLFDIVAEELKPHYLAAANRDRRDILALVMDMAERVGPEAFVRQSEAIRLRPDARPTLPEISCPTLVVGGAEDRLCPPEWQAELAALIPAAQLCILPGSGHFTPVEQSADFERALLHWSEAHRHLWARC